MILVTGAAGRLARRVVVCLAERGYDVLGTDREPCNEASLSFVQADLCDVSRVMELASGVEAIIHMGAIPGPGLDEYKTFGNNVQSTFNVLEAAAYYKIPRVVFSSTALVMGFAHDPLAFVPRYLPLDEEHPVAPFESYGLSKEVGECIGRMVARTTGNFGGESTLCQRGYAGATSGVPLARAVAGKPDNISHVGLRRST